MRPGLFRLALAALVVIHHTTTYCFGTFAVLTFFILSGYVITLAWERRYSPMAYAPFVFIASRLWRLYPAFAISIALSAYVTGSPVSLKSFSLFGAVSNTVNPPVWSLDFEAQFYLMVPLIVPAIVGRVAAAYAAVAMVVWFILLFMPVDNPAPIIGLLPFFMVGVIVARLKHRIDGRVAAASLAAGVILVGLSYQYEATQHVFFKQYTDPTTFRHLIWGSAALAFVCAPFALWTAQRRGGRIDNVFAGLSYTLYLAHWMIVTPGGIRVASIWPRVRAHLPFVTETVILWILCLLAGLVLLALEAPSEWARAHVIYHRRKPPRITSEDLAS
jgi:peptidoglycan/LPS O-acetylase OafA/YrhL